MLSSADINAQEQTVGLFVNDTASFDGYTLYTYSNSSAILDSTKGYLIDNYGRLVHTWIFPFIVGWSAYLEENGDLVAFSRREFEQSQGAHLFKLDWDSNIIWEWEDSSSSYYHHHDIEPMPNGNVLILAQDFRTKAEAADAGRDTSLFTEDTLRSETIIEVQPTGPNSGNIIWQWYVWDHLVQDVDSNNANYGVVEDHPELLDANYPGSGTDWLHSNGIDYNAEVDQIIISFRTSSEFWVLDHSATTAEAAGHTGGDRGKGGDILYRWGNPAMYRRGDSSDQKLSKQHDANWIAPGLPGEGHILIFNNGNDFGYSSVVEIIPPYDINGDYPELLAGEAHGPVDPVWTYVNDPPEDFYASFVSGARRMPNGNTLICRGPTGEFREVTPSSDIVWFYVNPVRNTGPVEQGVPISTNLVFRCYRYGADYPAFEGKDLTPTSALELYPITISGTSHWPETPSPMDPTMGVTTFISASAGVSSAEVVFDTGSGEFSVALLDDGMHQDGSAGDGLYGAMITPPSVSDFIKYYVKVEDNSSDSVVYPPNPPITTFYARTGYTCGNINGITSTGPLDLLDLNYLINYLFRLGPAPPNTDAANLDGNDPGIGNPVNILDLTIAVNYIFRLGPAPTCGESS